jgi:LysR family transcriptional regulator, transcriptional activator for bauABCD operon
MNARADEHAMNSPLPDLKLLRIFVAVVRHQGFAAAQQELNLSTSAISTYMSQLEAHLGITLCHRGRGGFSLTSKGELFYQETLRLLGELEGFERYAAALKGELRGTLNLGVLDTTVSDAALPLAEVIGAYSQEHPAVHLHLSVMSPYELQLAVLENRLDLAISACPTRMNGLLYQPLYREQHWLYCSERHSLFGERRIPAELIAQQRMVGRGYWSQSELARHGFKHSAATVESMEAQLILILSGAYIGYLPEHYAQPWVEQGRLRVLLPSTFGYQAPFSLILRRGRSREALIQAFRDLLKAQLITS